MRICQDAQGTVAELGKRRVYISDRKQVQGRQYIFLFPFPGEKKRKRIEESIGTSSVKYRRRKAWLQRSAPGGDKQIGWLKVIDNGLAGNGG